MSMEWGSQQPARASWRAGRSSACRSVCCCPPRMVKLMSGDHRPGLRHAGAGGCRSWSASCWSASGCTCGCGCWRARRSPRCKQQQAVRASCRSSRCSDPVAGDPHLGVRPDVRAGAVLPVHHVRADLRHRAAEAGPRPALLNDTLVAAAVGLISVPLFGHLSDLIGRRLMYGIGIVVHRAVRVPLLRAAQHDGGRAGAAGDRAVADLPRHAVRPAGRADRGELRHEHPLQRSRVGLPARVRHRRRAGAADRRGHPAEHRVEHLDQHLHHRLLRGLDHRAAAHAAAVGPRRSPTSTTPRWSRCCPAGAGHVSRRPPAGRPPPGDRPSGVGGGRRRPHRAGRRASR